MSEQTQELSDYEQGYSDGRSAERLALLEAIKRAYQGAEPDYALDAIIGTILDLGVDLNEYGESEF